MTSSINTREMLELCDWLCAMRKHQGLSMRELSQRLNKPHTYIHKVEKGERRLDVVEFVWYCQALGCDPMEGVSRINRKRIYHKQPALSREE